MTKLKSVVPIVLSTFLFSSLCFSQTTEQNSIKVKTEKIRPVRIGAKIGYPNLIGGSVEYVTPLFGHKLSITGDYSLIKSDWILNMFEGEDTQDGADESTDLSFSYLELGLNYYFFKPGKGLYIGATYGSIKVNGLVTDIEPDNEDTDATGRTDVDFKNASFNLNLGAKLGKLFYFRPEIGYSFNSLPESYVVDVVFNRGTHEMQTFNLKDDTNAGLLFSGLKFNIGVGFSF